MRRVMLFITIAVILVIPGSFFVLLVSNQKTFFARPIRSISSPGWTYSVTLSGKEKMPSVPLVMNSVWFSVDKNKTRMIKQKKLHSGDWFDPSFEMLYPNQFWQAENILRLYRDTDFQDEKPAIAVITNTSRKTIRYLRIVSEDLYLLFELRRSQRSRFASHHLEVAPGFYLLRENSRTIRRLLN